MNTGEITVTCSRFTRGIMTKYRMTLACIQTFERYGHTFGVHIAAGRDMNAYYVSEVTTGYFVASGGTAKAAVLAARAVLDAVGEARTREAFGKRAAELAALGELPHADVRGRTGMDVRVGAEGVYRVHHRIPREFGAKYHGDPSDDRITHICVMTKPRGRSAVIGYEDEFGDISLRPPSPITYLHPKREVA